MKSKISFGRFVKQHHQALNLLQVELVRRIACVAIPIRKILSDYLRPHVQIMKHSARDVILKLYWQFFLRTFMDVLAIGAILTFALSIYASQQENGDPVQSEIGIASQAEIQTNERAPETPALPNLEIGKTCSYSRLGESVFSNTKLNDLLRMVNQNNASPHGGKWNSDSGTFNLGYWTEKENSNIRIAHAPACEEHLLIKEGDSRLTPIFPTWQSP